MNRRVWIVALSISGLLWAESQAYANSYNNYNNMMIQGPARRAGQTPLSDNVWTWQDIQLYCQSRWSAQSTSYNRCLERNRRKIGADKTPGDIQELRSLSGEKTQTTTPRVDDNAEQKAESPQQQKKY